MFRKKIKGNKPAPNELTGQKQLLKKNEAVVVTRFTEFQIVLLY